MGIIEGEEMSAWLSLALLIASCIILLLRHDIPTIGGMDSVIVAAMVTIVALMIYILGSLIKDNKNFVRQMFQNIIVLSCLGFMFYYGYQYRSELLLVFYQVGHQFQNVSNKVVSQGIQISFPSKEGRETIVRIRKQPDGHFVAHARINSISLNLIVDTGATVVVLKPSDASSVGIDLNKLKYSVPVQTANGIAYAARIQLHKVAVGPLTAYKVDAFVVRKGTLRRSLLGLSFLNRLKSYEVSGNYLRLKG